MQITKLILAMSAMSLAYHMDVAAEQRSLSAAAGTGRVQRWGGPVDEIRPRDVVWIPPGVKHWHGASPTTAMTHIAIQEHEGGKVVGWLEEASDEQCGNPPRSPR